MPKNISTTGSTSFGFTLVELLVAVFVFSIIIVLVGSMFVSALDLQRRAFNLQQAQESSSFVLETMLKEIRVSDIKSPDSGCSTSLTIINNPDFGEITYHLGGSANDQLWRTATVPTGTSDVPISSNTVQFSGLNFCVSGVATGDDLQPRVTLIASVKSANTKEQATIDIQTTLSPRQLND